jgi:hypothetical protein
MKSHVVAVHLQQEHDESVSQLLLLEQVAGQGVDSVISVNFVDGQEPPAVLFCFPVKIPCSGIKRIKSHGSQSAASPATTLCQKYTVFLHPLLSSRQNGRDKGNRIPVSR